MFWAAQLARNEEKVAKKRYSEVWDDEQLKGVVALAFPDRTWSAVMRQVGRIRGAYNRGKLTKGQVPDTRSYAYELKNGRLVKLSGRGKVLAEFELRALRKPKGAVKRTRATLAKDSNARRKP
jgi:hypothetical protein